MESWVNQPMVALELVWECRVGPPHRTWSGPGTCMGLLSATWKLHTRAITPSRCCSSSAGVPAGSRAGQSTAQQCTLPHVAQVVAASFLVMLLARYPSQGLPLNPSDGHKVIRVRSVLRLLRPSALCYVVTSCGHVMHVTRVQQQHVLLTHVC
jgi:hypothetical protein